MFYPLELQGRRGSGASPSDRSARSPGCFPLAFDVRSNVPFVVPFARGLLTFAQPRRNIDEPLVLCNDLLVRLLPGLPPIFPMLDLLAPLRTVLRSSEPDEPKRSLRRTALITGSVAAGAYLTGAVVRWLRHRRLPSPEALPKALEADARTFELMEGRSNFYVRPGTGTPIILLHSLNAAASSFEMKPIFEHLAATTDRPLYVVDWLGFGRSARPPVDYRPALYHRQLRRFLSEQVREPADLVALSLGAEYAAKVAHEMPVLVHRLVLINPTGLTEPRGSFHFDRTFIKLASRTGAFELLFARLTRRASLRRFYEQQVFLHPDRVSDELVDYAYTTAHAKGAHHAVCRFVDGTLFPPSAAVPIYARLYRPTLLITPEDASSTIQGFERTAEVVAQNARDLHRRRLPSGLLPQWEDPELLFDAIDDFLK